MKKTMLTYRILDKFESLIDSNLFSETAIEKIEDLAYCSAMTASCCETCNKSEWELFCNHIWRVFRINLDVIEEEKNKNDMANEAYEAFISDSDEITIYAIEEQEKMTGIVFTFKNHTFKYTEIDRDFYTEENCKFIA